MHLARPAATEGTGVSAAFTCRPLTLLFSQSRSKNDFLTRSVFTASVIHTKIMSTFAEESYPPKDYLDEDDLEIIHGLKTLERPHLSTPPSPELPNQFAAWDTPLWRCFGLALRWDSLKSQLCSAVATVRRTCAQAWPLPTSSVLRPF